MPFVTKIQGKKQALPGPMRIVPEGTRGAWLESLFESYAYISKCHTGLEITRTNAHKVTTVLLLP